MPPTSPVGGKGRSCSGSRCHARDSNIALQALAHDWRRHGRLQGFCRAYELLKPVQGEVDPSAWLIGHAPVEAHTRERRALLELAIPIPTPNSTPSPHVDRGSRPPARRAIGVSRVPESPPGLLGSRFLRAHAHARQGWDDGLTPSSYNFVMPSRDRKGVPMPPPTPGTRHPSEISRACGGSLGASPPARAGAGACVNDPRAPETRGRALLVVAKVSAVPRRIPPPTPPDSIKVMDPSLGGVEILVRPGLRLSEQGTNDVESYRIAIVYGAGETSAEALERCGARLRRLRFQLTSALVA
jgi:hypothetical protein